ncbi:gcn5-related n-acetyltransferase [Phyllosticta citriasiana]|uniref:gcn5-related n-acetyltransferase n=1 Tax=Phyllosticta citriasiana TaxID=595635 RepID=UPI0030FDCA17
MSTEPIIRLARREDVPEILAMIKELAIYENALDSVEATEESLLATLSFASSDAPTCTTTTSGYAKTFLILAPAADANGGSPQIAGMALFFHNYSTWRAAPGIYLEDLFVRPEYRKRGYGKLLLRALAGELMRVNGGRLEWSCLKWDESALGFYKSLGAERMDEWVGLRVEGDAVKSLAEGREGEGS